MKNPRLGSWTSVMYLIVALLVSVLIFFVIQGSSYLNVFFVAIWLLICGIYVEPWFFRVPKTEYTWIGKNSILVAFDSLPIQIRRGEAIVTLEPKTWRGKHSIYVFENHTWGYDRLLDGGDKTYVSLLAGVINAKRTPNGFLVYWEERETPWNVVGEKSK